MPKYWGKQIFAHGRFPEVGQKQKTERKRKKERMHDARKPPGLKICLIGPHTQPDDNCYLYN